MAATAATLEDLLKRDRALVLAALALLALLAWLDLAYMAAGMSDEPLAPARWSGAYFAAMFFMWGIMMAGMMIPSAAPAVLLFAALHRRGGAPAVAPALLFAGGYLVTWTAFSLVATLGQWRLSEAAILSTAMTSESAIFAGVLFIGAGLYQLTPLKTACLAKCRSPAQFLVEHRREGRFGPLIMGIDHGIYCVGCCWALMALLFAFGVMNLLWVAAVAGFVLAEKIFSTGPRMASVGGVAMMGIGLILLTT